jgi:flagellar hook-associated protein 1
MAGGLSGILNTARDALSAQSYGVSVAGQNITNVNTPGYSRREVILESRALGSEPYGGVHVRGLRQVTDAVLDRQQLVALGNKTSAEAHDRELQGIEALFNDEAGAGVSDQLGRLFASFDQLAARPNDATARAEVLQSADDLAASVRTIADDLASSREKLLQKARSIAESVNGRARDLAELNRRIHAEEVQGHDAADLKDQRNQVLLDLSQLVDVKTTIDGSGNVLVHSSGTVLVEGANARKLSIDLDAAGGIKVLAHSASAAAGDPGHDVTRFLTGGSLAGVKEARDVDVFEVARNFDTFVFDLANAVNTQHTAGFGQDGVNGRRLFDLFTTSPGAARSLQLSADVAGNPSRVAAAGAAGTLPGDSDNAAALAALGDTPLAGGRTAFEGYGDIVGDVGLRKSTAERDLQMREALHNQTAAMREAMSGVSIDEEMIALSKFQRAYAATSKVITTVDEMLGELIARLG